MKAMVCEMCQSNDVVKQDGMYVCQHCGTKYSVEEARKMLIEGTVVIDTSEEVKKYLQNARRAKSKEDWAETEKYYNLVEQNDPHCIEAIFYSAYGKAKTSLVEADFYKRQAAFRVLQNCISIVDDNYDMENEDEEKTILLSISADLFKMAQSNYVYNLKKNGYGVETWNDKLKTVELFNNLAVEFMSTLEHIAKKYPDCEKAKRKFFYELALKHAEYVLAHGSLANPDGIRNLIATYHKWLHEIDPSHVFPTEETAVSSNGGCYIATAIYGSYDCPQVWMLRRFRDNTLAETWYGRAFIHVYYAVSPTLVKWFGRTQWFKHVWQPVLDRMVSRLKASGVEDTPYDDKPW